MADMTGKTVIVTGATNGIGEVTALELARMGAAVVIISRSEQKCQDTVGRIQQETDNPSVSYLIADLSSIEQIRRVAAEFRASHDRLDVLVNNAGAVFNNRKESVDGIEMTMALNHISYFLLTNELLDLIRQTAVNNPDWGARIVNVSSEAHRTDMRWDDLQFERSYSGFGAYGQSKHMNVLFTYELARRLAGTGVTANVLHPGLVSTGFGKNNGLLTNVILMALRPFAKSPEEGAETSIYLASSPEVKDVTGQYFANCKPRASKAETRDENAWLRLWAISEEMTHITATV